MLATGRWRIENVFKYASKHNGIDAIADYRMHIGPDRRAVANPARKAARTHVAAAAAEQTLAEAERALAQALNDPQERVHDTNAAIPGLQHTIEQATAARDARRESLKPIPAKVLATDLDPDAQHARPHLQRRGLQMVAGCWRSTPRRSSPNTSTTPMSTWPSPATCSASAARSATSRTRSPSPWTDQTHPE